MKFYFALLLTLLAGRPFLGLAQNNAFVHADGGKLYIGAAPYRFVGTNLWYAMNMGAETSGDRQRLVRELDRLQALGIQNIRLMAATEGLPLERRLSPTSQPEAGVYDENQLRGLDFALMEMGKRNMRAVLCLNNFFQWSGGMSQYVAWATGTEIPFPEQNGHSWEEYQNYTAQFYKEKKARKIFKKYLKNLLKRRNTLTGMVYKKDPVIMAWQLANEPREYGQTRAYIRWARKTARFIQCKDRRHLVSLGSEGILSEKAGAAWTKLAHNRHVDYLTLHLWVENWNWYDPQHPESSFDSALIKAQAYLARHLDVARQAGKPIVMEEFGIGRDGGSHDPNAPTLYRDHYYQTLLDQALGQANGFAGVNFWSWAGEGRPSAPEAWWQPGQSFTGDPPHEKQGWYSVYLTDTSTTAILKKWSGILSEKEKIRPEKLQK